MIRSYYDLSEVLIHEMPVPVVFTVPCFSIAKDLVARSAEGERLQEIDRGARATVPMWAAEPLRRSGFLTVAAVPQEYHNLTFREFKIDPLAPNLRAKSPFYYEHGLGIASLLSAASGRARLQKQLMHLLQLRFYPILNATSHKGHDFQDLRDTLTDAEQKLLRDVWVHETAEKQWTRTIGVRNP